jgi:K+ transporter
MPSALSLNLRHNRVLHDLVVILKIDTERSPRVAEEKRVLVDTLGVGLLHVTIHSASLKSPTCLPRSKRTLMRLDSTRVMRRFFSDVRCRCPPCDRNYRCGRNIFMRS